METQEKNKKDASGKNLKKENRFSIRASTVFLNLIVVLVICMACYFTYNVITGNAPEVSSEPPFTPVTEYVSQPQTEPEELSQPAESSDNDSEGTDSSTDVSSEDNSSQTVASGEYDRDFFSDTLFIGDSISTGLSLYGFLDADNVFAVQGLAPSTLFSTEIDGKTCEDAIASLKPKKIVVMLGTNGFGYGDTKDIADSMNNTLGLLKDMFNGKLAVISAPPITAEAEASDENMITLDIVKEYNSLVKQYAEDNGITYIDLYSVLIDESGYFDPDYAEYDGIHFMGETYKVMLSVVQSKLQ